MTLQINLEIAKYIIDLGIINIFLYDPNNTL
jgi:hypothetical protein